MAKPGPKPGASEEVIIDHILSGESDRSIASTVGVSRTVVARVRQTYTDRKLAITNVDQLKPLVKVELTQEIAKQGLGKVLAECEKNYLDAMSVKDLQMAGAWLKQWQDALDKLLKVTGLYNQKPQEMTPDSAVTIVFNLVK